MSELNTPEIMATWKWRIVKAGKTAFSFSKMVGINPAIMNGYVNGSKMPPIDRFDMIENALRELGV